MDKVSAAASDAVVRLLEGRYSPQHDCHVLAVLRLLEVSAVGEVQMPWTSLSSRTGVAGPCCCSYECTLEALVCRVRAGMVVAGVVSSVHEHEMRLLVGPVVVIVFRPLDDGDHAHAYETVPQPAWRPTGIRAARWRLANDSGELAGQQPIDAAVIAPMSLVLVHIDEVHDMNDGQVAYASLVAQSIVVDETTALRIM